MSGRFIFLGTGGSMGVPVIGCSCSVCLSKNPKDCRARSSAIIEVNGKRLLLDAGPDIRMQLLRQKVEAIDGVILTHAHQDHTGGVDELRVFYMWTKQPIPCLVSKITMDDVMQRFPYIFQEGGKSFRTKFAIHYFDKERGETLFEGIRIKYFTFMQYDMPVNGIRIGDFAYVSDIKTYPETIFDDLEGVEILVLSALRNEPSPLHFCVQDALDFSKKTGAKRVYLTHIAHHLLHEQTNEQLPANTSLAYDGLTVSI